MLRLIFILIVIAHVLFLSFYRIIFLILIKTKHKSAKLKPIFQRFDWYLYIEHYR